MKVRFVWLWCPSIVLVALLSTVFAQDRAPVRGTGSLTDFDNSVEALVRTVDPSVVQVFTTGLTPIAGVVSDQSSLVTTQRASGSGVIVDAEGYIVTNAHVVRGASRIRVEIPTARQGQSLLARRSRLAPARVIGVDEETDIAVLRVEERGLPALPFGDSEEIRAGQMVLAFGSPLGLQNSVSLGIVSAAARQLEAESPMVYIQTDASINSGNSGGPLVDTRGRLIGINTLILSGGAPNTAGPGFAAPSNIVRTVFEQIRRTGRVRRGEIGVRAQTITPILASGLGLKRDQGAVLADVAPGSPADRAGLSVGDLVLTIDGKPIENGRQLHVNLYRREVGDVVKLEVLRGDQPTTVSVPVSERADPLSAATLLSDPRENIVPRLGILGATLDPKLAAVLPLRAKAGVVVASASTEVLDTDNGGLAPGDVIHALNGHWIADLPALRAALDTIKPGAPVVLQIERRGSLLYLAFTIE